jgi:hypothetical protein
MLPKLRVFSPTALRFRLALGAILLMICSGMLAQTTVSTGSIVGTLTDPQGAVISGARVTVTNVQHLTGHCTRRCDGKPGREPAD